MHHTFICLLGMAKPSSHQMWNALKRAPSQALIHIMKLLTSCHLSAIPMCFSSVLSPDDSLNYFSLSNFSPRISSVVIDSWSFLGIFFQKEVLMLILNSTRFRLKEKISPLGSPDRTNSGLWMHTGWPQNLGCFLVKIKDFFLIVMIGMIGTEPSKRKQHLFESFSA